MMNRIRRGISVFGIKSRLFVFTAKQGNPNPLIILCSSFHTSNQCTLRWPDRNYGFEDIKNLDEAVTLFHQMLQMKPMPPICDLHKLFNIIVKMNHQSQVVFLFKKLSLWGFHFSRNNSRLRKNCKYWYGFDQIKNIDDAVDLFHQMLWLKPMPPVYDYGQLLNIIVKMKEYAQCIFMFKKMILLGCPIDDFIMTTVMKCYCNLREVGLGFAVLASMIKRGYAPDIVAITCLIKGFFLEEDVANAVQLFKKMFRDKLCEVNEITISTVLYGLSKSGYLVNAVKLLEILEKKNCELNVVVYTTVLDGLCKARMFEDAMNLLFKMIDRGILPNVVTYTTFLHGLCNHKKLDFARNIFNDLPSKKIHPDKIAYSVMIQGLCQKGLFQDVKEMLEKMERVGRFPDSVTYNIIIQGCLRHFDSFYSIDLFKQIIEKDFQLDARTFFMLLHQMRGSYGGDVSINNLIQKLISNDTRYQMQGNNGDIMINSLIQKLISCDTIHFME